MNRLIISEFSFARRLAFQKQIAINTDRNVDAVVDRDFEEIGNSYEKIKSQDITLHTTVKILGEDYEVMFTDLDGE